MSKSNEPYLNFKGESMNEFFKAHIIQMSSAKENLICQCLSIQGIFTAVFIF